MNKCKACTHEKAEEINAALVRNESIAEICRRYSLTRPSVYRHNTNHLAGSATSKQSIEATQKISKALSIPSDLTDPSTALAQLTKLASILWEGIERFHEDKNANSLIRFSPELRQTLQTIATITGELQRAQTQNIQIIVNPIVISLRNELITALEPFPEAKTRVIDILSKSIE